MATTFPSMPLDWKVTGHDRRLASFGGGVSVDGITFTVKDASRLPLFVVQTQFCRSHSLTNGSDPAAGRFVRCVGSGMQGAAGHWMTRYLPAVAWTFSVGPAAGLAPMARMATLIDVAANAGLTG